MRESSHNREDCTRRDRREEFLGYGRPPRKPLDFEIEMVMANKEEPSKKVDKEVDSKATKKESATNKFK